MKIIVISKNKNSLKKIGMFTKSGLEFVSFEQKFDANNCSFFIIETDFSDKKYSSIVESFMQKHSNSIFWAGNFLCAKDDIIKAYSMGFKNFVQFPLTSNVFENTINSTNLKKNTTKQKNELETFENMRITIVDDNKINIELLNEVLSVFKAEIVCFTNPFSALQFLKTNRSDLILLDVMMPEMNGFELAEKIKNSDINKETPIIFISALSGNINKAKGYKSGSFVYIEKPFEISSIRIQLTNILKIRKLQKQREDFIATLTHDLRTPLKAQIRALELLSEGRFGIVNPEQKEIISEILISCKFLQFMTDDVLIKYKYDNGKIQIKKEKYSLKKLTEEIITSFKYIFEQKHQTLKYCNKSNIDILEFDKIEISRVINNLLMNAVEYSEPNGSISISIEENTSNEVVFAVRNNGVAISDNEINSVFDRYYSNAKQYNKIGVGLGLYISKKIIELHNGKIILKNNHLENFTEFSFTIPFETSGLKTANIV